MFILSLVLFGCGSDDLSEEQLAYCTDSSEGDELIEEAEELGISFSDDFNSALDVIWDNWDGDFGSSYDTFKEERSALVQQQPWFKEVCASETSWLVDG